MFAEDAVHGGVAVAVAEAFGDLADAPALFVQACGVFGHALFFGGTGGGAVFGGDEGAYVGAAVSAVAAGGPQGG